MGDETDHPIETPAQAEKRPGEPGGEPRATPVANAGQDEAAAPSGETPGSPPAHAGEAGQEGATPEEPRSGESPQEEGKPGPEQPRAKSTGPKLKGMRESTPSASQADERPGPTDEELWKKIEADPSQAGLIKGLIETFVRLLQDYRLDSRRDHIAGSQYNAPQGQQFVRSNVQIYNIQPQVVADRPLSKADPGLEIAVDFEALRATFVPPDCYENALELLRQHSALIVSGAPGNGRRTLACYLLYQLGGFSQDVRLRQLNSASNLLDLDEEVFAQVETHRVYLLCPDLSTGDEMLNRGDLERLVERVRQKNSRVVVIWPEGVAAPPGIRWQVHLGTHTLLRSVDVFRKHLAYLLALQQVEVEERQCDALLGCEDIHKALSEAPHLKRVVYWATLVAERLRAGKTAEEIACECRQQRAQWLRQDALEMIIAAPSQAHLCLLMAAAVMSGINVDFFKPLADDLREALETGFDKEDHEYWQQFWAGPRSRWLEAAHAQVTPMTEWVNDRPVRVDVIKISPEIMSISLVDVFWDEYSQHRGVFRDWLEKCGCHGNFRVRLAAARALGMLFLRDLNIAQSVIRKWVLTEDIAIQESAAMSLAIASAQNPSTAQSVLNQIDEWTGDGESRPRLLFASAIIYAWLGMKAPEKFIRGIDRLVKSRDVWVLEVHGRGATLTDTSAWRLSVVRFAFQRFLQLGNFESQDHVDLLNRMLAWAQGTSRIQRRIAREVFVDMMLADEAIQVTPWQEREDGSAPAWPILLRIMQQGNPLPLRAAQLFEHAAVSRGTGQFSLGGVKRMIIFAGGQPDARPVLKSFLYALLTNGKQPEVGKWLKERLVHWAKTSDLAAHPAPYSKHLADWLRECNLL